ncbi:RUN domain containing protein [Trichuris trichiura]|uniref:RUN domain containing protein n=1 Tax=Trichuris trichiura TaxID=36087 RepID=A0A077Z634_TRITR|nr:RUN domain containing protein [Trichuris trichiura]
MSVSHPSLNQLKAIVRLLYSEQEDITDCSETLLKLCVCLESIFFFGTYEQPERTADLLWESICCLPLYYEKTEFPASVEGCVKFVLDCKDVQTHRGRLRLLIRCALQRRILHIIVELLVRRSEILKNIYDSASVLGDQILSEILIASLAVLNHCNFKLTLKNSAFLDQQWNLPLYKMYELVPCERIGLHVRFSKGYVIVMKVEPGSVADEDLRIEPGDFIDELFGNKTFNMAKTTFFQLLTDYKRQPVYIGVMKCLDNDDKLYAPMKPILSSLKLSKDMLLQRRLERLEEIAAEEAALPVGGACTNMDSCCGRISAIYRGSTRVEDSASEDQLGSGILRILLSPMQSRRVIISLLPTKVSVRTVDTGETLFEHGFPQIACCGRRADSRQNFAFVVRMSKMRSEIQKEGYQIREGWLAAVLGCTKRRSQMKHERSAPIKGMLL